MLRALVKCQQHVVTYTGAEGIKAQNGYSKVAQPCKIKATPQRATLISLFTFNLLAYTDLGCRQNVPVIRKVTLTPRIIAGTVLVCMFGVCESLGIVA